MAGDEIERIAAEVRREPAAIRSLARETLPKASPGSIFVGAGDSYAAGLAGFYASRGKCLAVDPYALASDPEMARGRDVYFISASGKTSANLAASKLVKPLARRTRAITAVKDSPLGRETDGTIVLPMRYIPRTPGFLSFVLSLYAVLKIASVNQLGDSARSFKAAEEDSGLISFGEGTTFFLGNSLDHPAAMYAAAKSYEMLGAKAQAELLEEFSHLELFSLSKGDSVVIFSSFDPSAVAPKLQKLLAGQGYRASVVPSGGSTSAERVFHSVFAAQFAVLGACREARLDRPRFLGLRGSLKASDAMIY